jgi:hypothetical protein
LERSLCSRTTGDGAVGWYAADKRAVCVCERARLRSHLSASTEGPGNSRTKLGIDLMAGELNISQQGVVETSSAYTLSEEFLDRLNVKVLDEIIRVTKELQAEKTHSKKTH